MKTLSYEEFIDIMDCLLTNGADNTDITIIHVLSETNTAGVVGCGDTTLEPGKYLFVWDTTNEDDQKWSILYAYINTHNFEDYKGDNSKFELLLSDEDDTCVCIFKLTEE